MFDETKAQRLRHFDEISRGVIPDSEEHLAAQEYFKRKIMMLPERAFENAHSLTEPNGSKIQDSFVDAVHSFVNYVNQNEIIASNTYEEAFVRLPEKDRNISSGAGSVLHRLALQLRGVCHA